MKLNKNYLVHQTGSETYLIPTAGAAFNGMVRGNATFGAILELLQQDTTEEEIVSALCGRFSGTTAESVAADVGKAVSRLRGIGAIDD